MSRKGITSIGPISKDHIDAIDEAVEREDRNERLLSRIYDKRLKTRPEVKFIRWKFEEDGENEK